MAKSKVAVIGAGAMGGALALAFERAGNEVVLCGTELDTSILSEIADSRVHPSLECPVPEGVGLAGPGEWEGPLRQASVAALAVASSGVRATVAKASPMLTEGAIWAVASKGWDPDSGEPLSHVVHETSPSYPVVIVVGPTLAAEVAMGTPTALVCASRDIAAAEAVAMSITSAGLRAFTTDDVPGVEVGAALKNVLAIAVGICDGIAEAKGRPMTNAKAALFSRGLSEMGRLAVALGGRRETVLGLSGAGDLFVTVLGGRNGRFGRLVGAGLPPAKAMEEMGTTVEGFDNSILAHRLAELHMLDLEVTDLVFSVLHEGADPEDAIESLMLGPVEPEM